MSKVRVAGIWRFTAHPYSRYRVVSPANSYTPCSERGGVSQAATRQ